MSFKELIINAGSSSLKYQVFEMPEAKVLAKGIFEQIGTDCTFTHKIDKDGEWMFLLKDARSNTGTFYMDNILGPKEQVRLSAGDIITIGATTMIFHLNDEDEE